MTHLEDKLDPQTNRRYLNKELLVGQVIALGGASIAALAASAVSDSKEQIALVSSIGDFVGFQIGFVACSYQNRKDCFDSLRDFGWYMLTRATLVTLPAGICYHAARGSATYALQYAPLSPQVAAILAHIPATAVFIGVGNMVNYGLEYFRKTYKG